jgi:hypothetical protein
MTTSLIWLIAAVAIAGVLFRPRGWPEAVWACLGAFILVVFGLLPLSRAAAAIAKGSDVYLFLTGMMLLSELAHRRLPRSLAGVARNAWRADIGYAFGIDLAGGYVKRKAGADRCHRSEYQLPGKLNGSRQAEAIAGVVIGPAPFRAQIVAVRRKKRRE